MGNALAGEMMRDGIAIGADKGVLVSDERMAGSDTLATGLVLAKAIEKLGGADLVFTGKRSTDGDTGQIRRLLPSVWVWPSFPMPIRSVSTARR